MQLNFIYPRSCRLRIQQPLSLSAVSSAKKKIRRETSCLQWRGASKEATNIKR